MKGAHGAIRTKVKIGQLTDVSQCNFQQYLFCNRRRGREERKPAACSVPCPGALPREQAGAAAGAQRFASTGPLNQVEGTPRWTR